MGYKYNAKRTMEVEDKLVLLLVSEAIDYTHAEQDMPIIDIDTEAFFKHCERKIFKSIIDLNVNHLHIDRHQIEFDLRLKFLNAMNRICMYNVEKIKLLEMGNRFIQEYIDYLNK